MIPDYIYKLYDIYSLGNRLSGFLMILSPKPKIGFQKVGFLREGAYINGKRDDVIIMDIIKNDFIQQYGVLPKGDIPRLD